MTQEPSRSAFNNAGTGQRTNQKIPLATAIDLAKRGFPVFPIKPDSKEPAVKGWQTWAESDPGEVAMNWPACKNHNVGVSTTDLIVIDVDAAKGGFDSLQSLGDLPKTFSVETARCGAHIYFKNSTGKRFGNRVDLLPGIDIRAAGGYVVGPGSTFEGRPYSIKDESTVADAPEQLIKMLSEKREKAPDAGQVPDAVELDTPEAVGSAVAYLLRDAPEAIEKSGGDNTAFKVAARVLDFGVSKPVAVELLADHWNDRCSPPWSLEQLTKKVENAAAYRQDPIGREQLRSDSPFEAIEEPPRKTLLEFPAEISLDAIIQAKENELVRDLIAPGDFCVLYGPLGVGKTFLALDLAWHMALGLPDWHGREVRRRAPVLYVSLEGLRGFRTRQKALIETLGDPGRFFARLNIDVSLVAEKSGDHGVQTIIEAARELEEKAGQKLGMIVIDTLSRAIAGDDENGADKMSAFIQRRTQPIIHATGACLTALHHPNKHGDIRGSTATKGAADVVLSATPLEVEHANKKHAHAGEVTKYRLVAEKVKDGESGKIFDYTLKQVVLAESNKVGPIRSCIVEANKGSSAATIEVTKRMMTELIQKGETLSPKPKAPNYAPRRLRELNNQHTVAEYEFAIHVLTGTVLKIEEYDNKGKLARKYAFLETLFNNIEPPPASSAGYAAGSNSAGSAGCPPVRPETDGSQ